MATLRKGLISGSRGTVPVAARRNLRIDGLAEIQAKLANILDHTTGTKAKEVYFQAAQVGKEAILAITPLGPTGNLRKAIFAAHGDPEKPNALVGVNHRIAPHAHLVEYGHAGPHPAPPHPYFRPGIVDASPGMKEVIEKGLTGIIEEAARS